MIRQVFLCAFLFIAFSSKGQVLDYANYAYPIYGKTTEGLLTGGVGVFINYKGQVYLVTCAHVITKVDPVRGLVNPNSPNFFIVSIDHEDTTFSKALLIDVSKINDTIKLFRASQRPDLMIIPINNKKLPNVKALTLTEVKPYNEDSIKSVFFYSFNKYVYYKATPNYNKHNDDRINYLITPDSILGKPGNSGCPVFYYYGNNKNPVFGGIYFGGNEEYGIVVRPEIVLKALKEESERR